MDLESIIILSSWPDMPINKNESEIQMFTKYFEKIDKSIVLQQMQDKRNVEDTGKNKNVANTLREEGNICYTNLDYVEALKLYSLSISRAPPNSKEFGLAIANRSAVLFDLEKYEECLQDTNTALKSEFPKDLRYKIFLRQSKCYLKFNNNFEAAKSLRKAEECIGKLNMGQLQIATLNDAIKELKNKLKEQIETTAPENGSDDLVLTEPTLKDGENPKFLDAAKVVDYKYTKKLGRHVVANTEIKKGDVLFIEKPYSIAAIHVQEEKVHMNICAFCFKSALNCIPCTVCSTYFYCSDSCRQGAWDLGHRWECLGTSQKIITSVLCTLSLSTLFQASRDGFKTTIEDETVYGNKANNYPFVNKLVTHKNKTSIDTLQVVIKYAMWLVMYLKNFTDYFDWLNVQPNRPEGSLEELYNFIGGQLVKYLLQSKCNSVVIREVTVNFYPIKVEMKHAGAGAGIYVSNALLNHSCLPNAIRSFDGTTCIVRAVGDIRKGAEITINYLEDSYFRIETEARQAKLKRYMFTCSCPPCADSSFKMLPQPWICPRCSGKAFQLENIPFFVECIDCFKSVTIFEYIINKQKIKASLSMYEISGDEEFLDACYRLMKETFHKYNECYFAYYTVSLEHYKRTDQFKKCMDIMKSYLELIKNIYGESVVEYTCSFLSYTYLLATYAIILRKMSKNNKKFVDEAKALIKNSVDILQYYVNNRNIKKFIANITKYLNSDNVNMVVDNLVFDEQEDIEFILPF